MSNTMFFPGHRQLYYSFHFQDVKDLKGEKWSMKIEF